MPNSHNSPTVLILGAGGKVGRMLNGYWRSNPPMGIDPQYQTSGAHSGVPPPDSVHWRPGDDPSLLMGAGVMVVLWGVTPGSDHPMSQNSALAQSALEIAAAIGVERVLLASSAAVYTGTEAESHAEAEALMPPRGAYGQAKLAMEQMARQWARGRATSRLTLLRMANVIGADSLFANLRPGAEVQLDRFASGGGPKRSYLAVDDFAHVIEHLATCADAALPEVLNVAGEKALAMSELVERGGGSVAWRTAPPTALERVELDTTLLKSLVGSLPASSDPTRAIESWQRTRVQA